MKQQQGIGDRQRADWSAELLQNTDTRPGQLWDNLAVNARRHPDKPALAFCGTTVTYAALQDASERLAAGLATLGVRRGDRVLVMMQNCPQLVMAHYAIMRANAVVVPINPMSRETELQHIIADSGARVALCTGDLAPEMARASNALDAEQRLLHLVATQFLNGVTEEDTDVPEPWSEWLWTRYAPCDLKDGSFHAWDSLLATGHPPPKREGDALELTVLPYTSGTTGRPKGCMHTHYSIMHNAVATWQWLGCTADAVLLGVLPMFHITGLVCVMHSTLYGGATLVIMPRWDRSVAAQLIARHRVTHWINIPTMIVDLLGEDDPERVDLSSLEFIGGGGAAMPKPVAERLAERFGLRFVEGYGLTETSGPTHMNPGNAPKLQCLGIPFPSTDARVIDPDTLEVLPADERGEIVIHGPQVFEGYWNRPDATHEAFVVIDDKYFFRTGDLGYVDADGYFFMTDRLKRMINASGYKVWPAEVESLMFNHPGIQEVCIIAAQDDYRGETVKAVVVKRPDHPNLPEREIIDWCREHMAAYKVPRMVEFSDALPKSGSGKVMWRVLQEAEMDRS